VIAPASSTPAFQLLGHRDQDIQHGLLAALRLAARLHRRDRAAESTHQVGAGRLGRQVLAQSHEQGAVKRTGGAADLHHQHGADALQEIGPGLGAEIGGIGQHGLKAALHVEAMVAIADRLVEGRQLLGVALDRRRHRPHQLRPQTRPQIHASNS
jgi:hypothetical protein